MSNKAQPTPVKPLPKTPPPFSTADDGCERHPRADCPPDKDYGCIGAVYKTIASEHNGGEFERRKLDKETNALAAQGWRLLASGEQMKHGVMKEHPWSGEYTDAVYASWRLMTLACPQKRKGGDRRKLGYGRRKDERAQQSGPQSANDKRAYRDTEGGEQAAYAERRAVFCRRDLGWS